MSSTKTYIFALASLLAGAIIYITCRTHIIFVEWLHMDAFPSWQANTSNPFIYWLVFCLPDGLWYLALLLIQQRLLIKKSFISRICAITAVLSPFVIEWFQALHWMRGTFDWFDIITYLLILIIFLLCVKRNS